MNKAIALPLAALAAALVALPAAAQTGIDDQPHPYGGASLGWNGDDESTWRLFGGYQVNRYFGAEVGYHDLGQHNINGVTADSNAWELVGVGRLPITDALSAYGKLGAYRGESKGSGFSDNTNDLTFGAGVEYAITRSLAARGEWQRYRDIGDDLGGGSDLDVLSLGVIYRFR